MCPWTEAVVQITFRLEEGATEDDLADIRDALVALVRLDKRVAEVVKVGAGYD